MYQDSGQKFTEQLFSHKQWNLTAFVSNRMVLPLYFYTFIRFNYLDKKCRRSALATTDELNFRTFLLSHLMSALTFRSGTYNTPPE